MVFCEFNDTSAMCYGADCYCCAVYCIARSNRTFELNHVLTFILTTILV